MSNRIPQEFINNVIARTDIVELIEARIKIIKKGQNYLGLCPFHNEKSPSFTVSAQKQFYHCFGCGANGNAISFLMQYDHMDFLDAVDYLSGQLGLEVPQGEGKSSTPTHQDDFKLLEETCKFYQQQLRESVAAIDYLKSRGLTGQIAKQFQLGFAPQKWDSLIRHTASTPDSLTPLIRTGLVIQKEPQQNSHSKTYDRFRNRIMFPIRDQRGRVIAFGGRALGDDTPKYLNSPETPLFHKSQELYGLYEVLQHDAHPKRIVITEGYMDVIALHQYGLKNAVATLGTATNPKHLQKVFRYTNEVVFCFDGDNAGQNAAWKALTVNLPAMHDGIQLRFMFLPEKDDPDSLIRRIGLEGFLQRLDRAKPLSEVFFELIQQEVTIDSPDSKAQYAKLATRYLNQMPKGLFRELMLKQLAKRLNVYVSDLASFEQKSFSPRKPTATANSPMSPTQKAISLLLQQPKLCFECDLDTLTQQIAVPGMSLLIKLVKALQQQNSRSVGELINLCEQETEKHEVAALAAYQHPFPDEGMLAEFHGAIKRLAELYQESLTNTLIEKAKNQPLTPDEKKKLALLLTQGHKDII